MRTLPLSVALLVLGLNACGGGGTGSVLPTQTTPTNSLPALTQASISIVIPGVAPSSLTPRFVSPNTASISIALTSINGARVTLPAVVANIAPQSAGCTPQGGGRTCTISAQFPIGSDTFAVTLFAQPNASGSPLGSATATAQLQAGTLAQIPLSVGGIIASVSIVAQTTHPIAGVPTTIPLSITAFDASGATIVPPGDYATPIALVDSDTTGATSLSATTVTSPASTVSLTYTGSLRVAEAVISAQAFGVAPSAITSASVVPVGQSGSNALAIFTAPSGSAYAYVPTATGLSRVLLSAANATTTSSRRSLSIPAPIGISPAPNACALNGPDNLLACIAFSSPTITNFQINSDGSLTQLASVTTDAPSSGVSNSGGTCIICGIEYDDNDDAYIIATANGYEVYTSPIENNYTKQAWTISANVAENFGYNPVTDEILSPVYATIDATGLTAIKVAKQKAYVIATQPAGLFEPDASAFDSSTNIAAVTEEIANSNPPNTNDLFLENMNTASYNSPSNGEFNLTQASILLSSSLFGRASATTCDAAVTGIAIDSASHLAFVGSEFCGQGNASPDGNVTPFGVLALPSSSRSALTISNQVYLNMPPLPDGSLWDDAGDPHAIAAMPISGLCSPCGITYNLENTWLAVIDMNALLAAPRSPLDPNLAVIPQTPPYANIVTYFKAQ